MLGRGRGLLQSLKEKKEEKSETTPPVPGSSSMHPKLTAQVTEPVKQQSPQLMRRVIVKKKINLLKLTNFY